MIRNRFLMVILLSAAALQAQASDWFPLENGRSWIYADSGGGTTSVDVHSQELFEGETVWPVVYSSGTHEYYSVDGDGRVLFHGLILPNDYSLVFNPPIVRMEASLVSGQSWESNVEAVMFTDEGEEYRREAYRASFTVVGTTTVSVLAGTFQAIEVQRLDESNLVFPISFTEAFVEGIGWVRRGDDSSQAILFQLEAYGVGGVASESMSWGALKALYSD